MKLGLSKAALTGAVGPPNHPAPVPAQMAELVDALVSGTSAARRGGSSPLLGTKHLSMSQTLLSAMQSPSAPLTN